MKYIHVILITLAFLAPAKALANDDNALFEKIQKNIVSNTLNRTPQKEKDIQAIIDKMGEKGEFKDINYADKFVGAWTPCTHTSRLNQLIYAYCHPQSPVYGNEELYKRICQGLTYWYDMNPKSDNWWWQSIGWPQPLGLSLCLMQEASPKPLPQELTAKMAKRMAEISVGPDVATGANKQDIALVWFYIAMLTKDKEQLSHAVEQFYEPMAYTTEEGIQYDASYQQHGHQLYTSGYGTVVLNVFFKLAFFIKDTEYEKKEYTSILSDYIRNGIIPINRGAYTLFATGGRGHLSRIGATNGKGFATNIRQMADLDDPKYRETYLNAAARISGEKPADYGVKPWGHHYWTSNYSIHQRPEYTIDVHTTSTRTCRSENGNGENLKGYFAADGSMQIAVDGDEHFNIFPTWSWQHIPGTTVPNVPEVPLDKAWSVYGESDFCGGVDDGTYLCTTFHYVDSKFDINTKAHKSWFCFDNEIVCMGSGIESSNPNEIHTTVNQCLLKGDITTEDQKGHASTLGMGEHDSKNLKWVHHNKVSYYFPQPTDLHISSAECSGTWFDINTSTNKNLIKNNIFMTYINHGKMPENGDYVYYVMPNKSIPEAKKAMDKLTIKNTASLQYVYNHKLKMLQAVFHEPGEIKIKGVRLSASSPCIVLLTGIGTDSPKVHIADPLYKQESTQIRVKVPGMKERAIHVGFKTDKGHLGESVAYDLAKAETVR